ncbi:MAG: ComEA family DNA-binding protein [Candidatus Latescibacterota bacterium]
MFTFNRNEQIVLLILSLALLAGIVVSYLDRTDSDAIRDFDVKKNAIPVPEMPEVTHQEDLQKTLLIDINSATEKDFQKLPGIGPSIAQRIVAYRLQIGKFNTVDDLTNVSGIGPKTLERLRINLTIN